MREAAERMEKERESAVTMKGRRGTRRRRESERNRLFSAEGRWEGFEKCYQAAGTRDKPMVIAFSLRRVQGG